jgi:low affinity Fe/Cu permease
MVWLNMTCGIMLLLCAIFEQNTLTMDRQQSLSKNINRIIKKTKSNEGFDTVVQIRHRIGVIKRFRLTLEHRFHLR